MQNKLAEIPFTIEAKSDRYSYNGVFVPRVNDILSSMLSEDYLMRWANSLGFKRLSYKKTLEDYANIGTQVHEIIEAYIRDRSVNITDSTPATVVNAFTSFMDWYANVARNVDIFETISIEERLTCQWFGGTLDWLVNIGGKIYLVDFKSSNHIGYRYFLQMAAYRYMLKLLNRDIDGMIILQLSKNHVGFNEYIIRKDLPDHLEFMNHCEETFLSLTHSYYMRMRTEYLFNQLF